MSYVVCQDNMQHHDSPQDGESCFSCSTGHPKPTMPSKASEALLGAGKALRILTDLLLHLRGDFAASHQGLALETLHLRLAAG